MPLLWRFMLKEYFKYFFISATSALFILSTTRLRDLSRIISYGASVSQAFYFFLLQLPYLLPVIMPVAALIAGFNQYKSLSQKGQITALQSSALSLRQIMTPSLIAALFVSLGTFYTVSEVATGCQKATSNIRSQLSSINPLLLLKNRALLEGSSLFYTALGSEKLGLEANHAIIAMADKNKKLQILYADKWTQKDGVLFGDDVSWIAHDGKDRDQWWMQTSKRASLPLSQLTVRIKSHQSKQPMDHLKLIPLLQQGSSEQQTVLCEIIRRISLSIMPLTLTFLGAACGLRIGQRSGKNYTFVLLTLSAVVTFATYIASRQVSQTLFTSIFFFLPPPLLHILIGSSQLRRV